MLQRAAVGARHSFFVLFFVVFQVTNGPRISYSSGTFRLGSALSHSLSDSPPLIRRPARSG